MVTLTRTRPGSSSWNLFSKWAKLFSFGERSRRAWQSRYPEINPLKKKVGVLKVRYVPTVCSLDDQRNIRNTLRTESPETRVFGLSQVRIIADSIYQAKSL